VSSLRFLFFTVCVHYDCCSLRCVRDGSFSLVCVFVTVCVRYDLCFLPSVFVTVFLRFVFATVCVFY